ncbi:ABC transporter ATP-binding protein [Brucella haematophila]|uniref:ABC transporter ATP-binding protein n=1 Tax=Brucella haematophila TaxID=419474 RepID=A0ABX1DPF7_9HYPH|nr:ABC transporter ATP-binding protein [Brucella haematophila]NKC04813.1 ABC transporter ATP-binding protein [Brucella haematophila]TMV02091.1 ABC transporter ATP-binding protein [Brucella haematophila]
MKTTGNGTGHTAKNGPAAVSAKNVSMIYNGFHAVRSASFDLEQGRFLTILGPSGSGKTTLLRLIAGFQRPSVGEIFINGQAVSAVPSHKRSIGMVFQKLALFPHMTAAQNVAFPLKMRRFDARTIPERVECYLDLVRLGGLGNRRVHELSGGQQQRVAIARALVFEPDLLLLDEPLAALDRKLREEMQLEFRRIQRELGVTTINVTHDQREALVVSDEIIVMDGGEIQQMARPSETYRNPSNAFVANFIGVTNFITGKAASVDGSVVQVDAGPKLAGVMVDGHKPVAAGDAVSCAIRAEQIRIGANAESGAGLDTKLEGVVTDAIFEGERIVYELRVPALGDALMRVFDHDPVGHSQFEEGATVPIGWNARDLIVFAA